MAKSLRKYMNVDVVAFLEEQMKENTKHYQGDFEYDKETFARCAASPWKEDKTLLWLSRPCGTQCVKEHDAFLEGTAGHSTWQYYAQQEAGDRYVAFAVELTGVQDGVIRGNLYELDYEKHAEMVRCKAVPAYDVVKTFEDGFATQAPLARSSYGFWTEYVEKHGPVVDSLGVPSDKELHRAVIAEQRHARAGMKSAAWEPVRVQEQVIVADVLSDARVRAGEPAVRGDEKEFTLD